MDGWMDGWMNEWTDGWMNGWTVWWLDGWMDGWMDDWLAGWVSEWLTGWLSSNSPMTKLARLGTTLVPIAAPASKTPQLHTKMCLAGISCHAHKICSSSLSRVRHLGLFWLFLRYLTHDKEKKYLPCPKKCHPCSPNSVRHLFEKSCFLPRNRSGSHIGFAGSVEGSSKKW